MKSVLPGYYMEQDYVNSVWDNPLYILDANILLSFYSYKEISRKKILSSIKNIQPKLWIPHQVAYEYEKNREKVISEHLEKYQKLNQLPDAFRDKFLKTINEFEKHPSGKYPEIEAIFEDSFKIFQSNFNEKIKGTIKDDKKKYSNLKQEDIIQAELNELIGTRVGSGYNFSKLSSIVDEGNLRYENKIPPGYQDLYQIKKKGINAFGDLIIWYQILEQAKKVDNFNSVIFVTNDEKEDWWQLDKQGKIIKPRAELINELYDFSGKNSYFYTFDEFYLELNKRVFSKSSEQIEAEISEIKNAKKVLNRVNKIYNIKELVEEIKERKEDEFLNYEDVDKEFLSKVKEIRSHFDYHFITSHVFIWHDRLDQLCFNVYKSINSTECMRVANIMIQRNPDDKADHLITLSNNNVLNTEGNIEDIYEVIIDRLKDYL